MPEKLRLGRRDGFLETLVLHLDVVTGRGGKLNRGRGKTIGFLRNVQETQPTGALHRWQEAGEPLDYWSPFSHLVNDI